ncbi:MAG TPA: hypothetical protein VNO81_11050 [Candidatus Nitrosotenuis sp.]|jgi:chromosome segregation ATPase|nr:hypothetical protein [Candidatus Nitrosotenuis sp.]
MSLFDKVGDTLREAGKGVRKGREAAIRRSERMLRIERLKMDIKDLREEKEQKMRDLAHKVYELYTQNSLANPELVALCQEIKAMQWQIDEKWTEINHLKTRHD